LIHPDQSATVTVQITNTGSRAGWEVAQLYLTDLVSSVTRPDKELKGFYKIWLEPGESSEVTFTLTPEHLELVTSQLNRVVEPGEFRIQVGSSSVTGKSAVLTVMAAK
jgi:beta-glucosidase